MNEAETDRREALASWLDFTRTDIREAIEDVDRALTFAHGRHRERLTRCRSALQEALDHVGLHSVKA